MPGKPFKIPKELKNLGRKLLLHGRLANATLSTVEACKEFPDLVADIGRTIRKKSLLTYLSALDEQLPSVENGQPVSVSSGPEKCLFRKGREKGVAGAIRYQHVREARAGLVALGNCIRKEEWILAVLLAFDVASNLSDARLRSLLAESLPHVLRGVKTLVSAKSGHAKTHGTAEEKRARWAVFRAEFAEVKANRPLLSDECICGIVAKRHEVSARTIRRANFGK